MGIAFEGRLVSLFLLVPACSVPGAGGGAIAFEAAFGFRQSNVLPGADTDPGTDSLGVETAALAFETDPASDSYSLGVRTTPFGSAFAQPEAVTLGAGVKSSASS